MTGHRVLGGHNVLVTGGLGFIGSSLAYHLVEDGAHVTLVDSLVPEYGGNLFDISGRGSSELPHSEQAAAPVLSLPMYPDLTAKQVAYVTETI